MAFELLPYTNFHDLNLDWLLKQIPIIMEAAGQTSNIVEEAEAARDAAIDAKNDAETAVLNAVAAQGYAETAANSASISANSAAHYYNDIGNQTSGAVATWLAAHVDPDTGYIIDDTLTVSGAAADAKTVGANVKGLLDFWINTPINVQWEQGDISAADGTDVVSTSGVRSQIITNPSNMVVSISNFQSTGFYNQRYYIAVYDDDDTFQHKTGPYTGDYYVYIDNGWKFRITAENDDLSVLAPANGPTMDVTTYAYTDTDILAAPSHGTPGKAADAEAVCRELLSISQTIPGIDNTLSLAGNWAAGAKATGDEISNLKSQIEEDFDSTKKALSLAKDNYVYIPATWEQGLISGSDGSDTDDGSVTRCRTAEYFTNDVSISVDRSEIPYGTYLYYYDADKTFIKREVFNITESVVPDQAYPFYRVAILDFSNFSNQISASDAERNYIFYKRNETIKSLVSDVEKLENNLVELRVGELINGRLTADTTDTTDSFAPYRLSTTEIVAFPFGSNRKIKVKLNDSYLVGIRAGAISTNLDNNLYWFKDGDIITIPAGCNYYGVSVCNKAGGNPYTTKAIADTDNIGLHLYVENAHDILFTNDEAEKILTNARLYFNSNNPNSISRYAIIGHTSDCHGDYRRVENFFRFCDHIQADAGCITGDIVSYKPSQGVSWLGDLVDNYATLPAICTGNHDVYDNMDDDDVYDFLFADVAQKIGNTTGKTWYYKDITAKNIRIISINLYQHGGTNRWYTHFSNEQLAWLVSILGSTPNNYGVIILAHAPQTNLDSANNANYPTFFQDTRLYNNTMNAVSGGVPVYDIVDAFISRTTLSKTYTQTGIPSSVSVSADFTNVDQSVEFIAH